MILMMECGLINYYDFSSKRGSELSELCYWRYKSIYVSFPYRPDLIQYEKLQKSNAMHNLNNAFTTAEDKLGLVSLLDAEGELL